MNRLKEIGIVAALVAISAVPRFAGLGRFTSIDEPFWLRQSGNFYYALGQREFQNTLYEYHPAVTTMWIITAGMLMYFPEYRAMGQGYLKPGKFDEFMIENGKSMLDLLIASRAIQVVLILALLAGVYGLLHTLFDRRTAFFATGFMSLSPFLIGQSRLLNHEAMVGLFSLISLLGMLAYLYRSARFRFLLASAAAAALAQLTKSSAIPIVLLVILVVALHTMTNRQGHRRAALMGGLKTLGVWLVVLAATYVIVWPGMWVAPLTMLRDVYGNALSYALQGTRTSVAPGLEARGFDLASLVQGIGIYINDLTWRTTPLTALGIIASIWLAARRVKDAEDLSFRWLALYALLLAAAFVLLFGIQRSPKPPHYILTSYAALEVIAGLGIARGWARLTRAIPSMASPGISATVPAAFLALQLASAVTFYPYYISYYNPVVEALRPGVQNPTLNETGYGMGLEKAAAYLATKPNARELAVLAANGLGSFSYYFPGQTIPMNDFSMADPQIAELVPNVDYVVIDYYNHRRKHLAQDLESVEPETSLWLNGIEFLRIYPAAVFLPASP